VTSLLSAQPDLQVSKEYLLTLTLYKKSNQSLALLATRHRVLKKEAKANSTVMMLETLRNLIGDPWGLGY
jgi:hypothetical protein